ncbi:MAG: tetratricopeptide repeat protein [Immundisolibacter sp.]|uniref:tetratricopeptide repeat protein n=1 Tax=Immundisolibacter sp. TaxID=1934948 RepID=UPI003D0FB4B9
MNRLLFASLVLCLSGAQAAFLFPSQPEPAATSAADPGMQSYAEGVQALGNNHLLTAEDAFKAALKVNPRMVRALIGLADVALRRDDREQAKASLDKAVEIAPNDDTVQHALGLFAASGRDYPAAEAALRKAIEVNPANLAARNALGGLYAGAMQRPADAVGVYRAAIEVDSKQLEARLGLAQALAATGQFGAAETELTAATKAHPDSPFPPHLLGRMQLARGNTAAAAAATDAALKIAPDFVPALLDKGDVLLGAGKVEEALALYDRAIATDNRNATAQFKRGVLLQQQRRDAQARQAYLNVINIAPDFAPAYNNLAWMQAESGQQLDQAGQWAATAVKLEPNNPAFRDTQGWVYRAQRQFAEAETVLEKAATMPPPIADVHYHLGVVYVDQKKTDPARRAFKDALAIDPKHAAAAASLEKLGSQ